MILCTNTSVYAGVDDVVKLLTEADVEGMLTITNVERLAATSLGRGRCKVTFSRVPALIIVTSHAKQGALGFSGVAVLLASTVGRITIGYDSEAELYMQSISWDGLTLSYSLYYKTSYANEYVDSPNEIFVGLS